ncbi:phospho-N-acetylmuramoyl-pentapeptide-transferase [Candidatus Peribacteria bacterium RIFCSPLOWO2_12_FULL_55_15]|nr:MAG: phospho-N-acetylmuramoyl-pentapeptide-transferase [Candidatus Peribacteria bacterium RIFCSPHIGHO2_01_FULL_54_22]OGJ62566.1 MAG: phospho-N-acetylmuramoyl-pentapeptide-transferase [Candidatus Peribacteria bacterium RIFCSPHIGHO2_02_FULL_55_24]OGJ63671.1 MAG: phospho-N-acetylmuramoyl-pentapeptide-transferase [Candidatus Peribacteria bacterium RIFCSPHIGHO2_12_FULL_54_10]OGJ68579.1 MAG: phospho-N-acetylmuramoyl-pentapeptide-transferase [Candidatus Peribacteria bacterium RIFCSPLOWO2_01_FULL_54_
MPLYALPFRPEISLVSMFGYALFAFFGVLFLTPAFVTFLRSHRIGKQLRVETIDGREPTMFRKYHESKFGTPTMGGILIWGAIVLTVFFSRVLSFFGVVEHSLLQRGQVYLPLFVLVFLGTLGAIDDYLNVRGVGRRRGLDVLPKISFLFLVALVAAAWFYFRLGYDSIAIPFFGDVTLGWWYIPLFVFLIIGTANAVNITDGLDGLAGGLLVIAFGALGVLAYLNGLYILAAFCAVTVGAVAAFLWQNVPPALFFMGDTGSLALGGVLAMIALMIDQVAVLPFIGSVFVLETLSVILQLISKRFRCGKKVFLAAPLHHHFEALNWGESKVTMRLWIIGGFFAFLGIVLAVIW